MAGERKAARDVEAATGRTTMKISAQLYVDQVVWVEKIAAGLSFAEALRRLVDEGIEAVVEKGKRATREGEN